VGEKPAQEVPGCIGRSARSVSLMLRRDMRDFFLAASVIGEFFRTGIRKNMPSTLSFLLLEEFFELLLLMLLLLLLEGNRIFCFVSLIGPENDSDLVSSLLRLLDRASCSRSLLSLVRYSHRHLGLSFLYAV